MASLYLRYERQVTVNWTHVLTCVLQQDMMSASFFSDFGDGFRNANRFLISFNDTPGSRRLDLQAISWAVDRFSRPVPMMIAFARLNATPSYHTGRDTRIDYVQGRSNPDQDPESILVVKMFKTASESMSGHPEYFIYEHGPRDRPRGLMETRLKAVIDGVSWSYYISRSESLIDEHGRTREIAEKPLAYVTFKRSGGFDMQYMPANFANDESMYMLLTGCYIIMKNFMA